MKNSLDIEKATELLHSHMQNKNLRRHCYAVGKSLSAYYDFYKEKGIDTGKLTKEQWEITGILHDADWEETTDNPTQHTLTLLNWLEDYDLPVEMADAFKSHNTKITNLKTPQTILEWTLECCDELTGFIVAVALVMPERKLEMVTVERVLSKFKQKEFAKAVDRNQITQCEKVLNIDIQTFVEITLKAMQANSALLGL